MRHVRDHESDEPRLEMTPMIDVTFLLLVFFLCTLCFKSLEAKLEAYLPRDFGRAGAPTECEPAQVTILVPPERAGIRVFATGPQRGRPWNGDPGRRFEFEGRRPSYRLGPRRTEDLDEVESWLRDLAARAPDSRVVVEGRTGTVAGDVVEVLDRIHGAGIQRVSISAHER